MIMRLIIVALISMAYFGCNLDHAKNPTHQTPEKPKKPKKPKKPEKPEQPSIHSDAELMQKKFMDEKFRFSRITLPTVNSSASPYYLSSMPKATVFGDYNKKRSVSYLAVDLGWPFEKNLPKDILAELAKRNLLDSKSVDIAWVIQPLSSLGGNSDHDSKNITYIKAHGWADPDFNPLKPDGTRIKRDFLYGLYDADVDISHQVKLNSLKPFEIHTHDGMYSPETAAVHLPSDDPESMALWSLVIDSNNPENKVRAIATLHWLISRKDDLRFFKELYKEGEVSDINGTYTTNQIPVFATIGEYINFLNNKSFLKDTSLVKKLDVLVYGE